MLQITEQNRDVLIKLIIEGCYPNVTVKNVNNILTGLDNLKPVKKKTVAKKDKK
jgi:hypothetical protein